MPSELGHLHILCGKVAAGKSTLARRLADEGTAVLISEDQWLSELFGQEMTTIKDYVRCSARLRAAMEPHVAALLTAGVSVVLDFPANTPETRLWMRRLFDEVGCAHTLHFLDVSDEICKERLRARNAAGLHPFTVTDEQFEAITRHFVPPVAEEGFQVKTH